MTEQRPDADDVAIDPVCGEAVTPGAGTPSVYFRGLQFFFCRHPERGCLLAFKRAPEHWSEHRPAAGRRPQPRGPAPAARRDSPFQIVDARNQGPKDR